MAHFLISKATAIIIKKKHILKRLSPKSNEIITVEFLQLLDTKDATAK